MGGAKEVDDDGLESPNGTGGVSTPRTQEASRSKLNGTRINLDDPKGKIPTQPGLGDARGSLVAELKQMGFGEEAAVEAANHSTNVEGAVSWLLKHSGDAIIAVDMRPAQHRKLAEAVSAAGGDSAEAALLRVNSTSVDVGSMDQSPYSQRARNSSDPSDPQSNVLTRKGKPLLSAAPATANRAGYPASASPGPP